MVEERSRGCGRSPGSTLAILPAWQTTGQRKTQLADNAKEFFGCSPCIAPEAESSSKEGCCHTSESVLHTSDSAIRALRRIGVEGDAKYRRSKSCRRGAR